MAALVTEICSVYFKYDSSLLTPQHGNRVCNALALLQVIASHNQTVDFFLESKIPLFLYPFLQINCNKDKPFEFLKLTTLGVFGALVKKTNKNVIPFLLNYDLMPLCLSIMESNCNELSKIVATFIVQKILENEQGLNYCCETYNRFIQIYTCLNNMLNQLITEPSIRLFRHVLNCYHKLSLNRLGSAALKTCLPEPLKDNTFATFIKEDKQSANILTELIKNINKSDVISLINQQNY